MKSRYMLKTEEAEFRLFNKVKDDLAQQFIATVLFSQHIRYIDKSEAYRKKKVKQLYEDVKSLLEAPDILGKPLIATEAIELIKREYGIDVESDIRVDNHDKTYREYQRRTSK